MGSDKGLKSEKGWAVGLPEGREWTDWSPCPDLEAFPILVRPQASGPSLTRWHHREGFCYEGKKTHLS